MTKDELCEDFKKIVYRTLKNNSYLGTKVSDDKKAIIIEIDIMGLRKEISFPIVELMARRLSCLEFIHYLKSKIQSELGGMK